ncbi:MAG: zinc ribbon domain-containing protein, partial [Candidatus Bathyarchaeota archaeon]|nr:zinc ribbon domain-containing protein [Candidatus Bathyarchaeota archaeon]
KIDIEVVGPDCQTPSAGRILKVYSDDSGYWEALPFAGWNIGKYKLIASCNLETESKEIISAKNETSFVVNQATLVTDMHPQVEKIEKLYKSPPPVGVPEGPIRTRPEGPPWGLPEGLYGSYHNLFIAGTKLDPPKDFACGGCQTQSLKFMDGLRFNKDPEVRKLLKGLDHGPIARGMGTVDVSVPKFGETTLVGLGNHHAVILYPIGTEWNTWLPSEYPGQWPEVFDLWPKQKPEVVSIAKFCGMWGFPRVEAELMANLKENIWTGYPLTGGVIYVNFEAINAKRPSIPPPKISTVVDCPVDVLITNSKGNRVGKLPNGSLVQEFTAYAYQAIGENNETLGWYFGLPEGAYSMNIAGLSTGTFRLLVRDEATGGNTVLDYGNQSITKDGQAKMILGEGKKEPLILPSGEKVSPKEIPLQLPIPPTPFIPYEYVVLVAVIMFVVVTVYLRKRSKSQSTKLVQAPLQSQPPQYVQQPPPVSPPVVAARPPLQIQRPVEEQIACPSCGAPNLLASKFCGKCGGTLQQTYAFCEECGRRIPEGATYCKYCGDKQGVA